MDSFALAHIPSSNEMDADFSVKVNINLWTQCGWGNDDPVLDIGLLISKLSAAQTIRLYIPFPVKKNELVDLCECLSRDAELLGAVFNEPYTSADIPTQTKKTEVFEAKTKNTIFILYKVDFSSDNDVVLVQYKNGPIEGTFLDFKAENILGSSQNIECDNYYIRFRIQSSELRKCVREYVAPNRYFETLVNSTYMVEMRFNNTRSMDRSLVQKLTNQGNWSLTPINGMHFLLMTKVDVDVSNDFGSSRVLERKTWDKYVNLNSEGRPTEDIIGYHSSKKAKPEQAADGNTGVKDIGSWEFFTRIKTGHCNTWTIVPYVFLLILFNVLSNLVFNIILSFIPMQADGNKMLLPQLVILVVVGITCYFILFKKKKNKRVDK